MQNLDLRRKLTFCFGVMLILLLAGGLFGILQMRQAAGLLASSAPDAAAEVRPFLDRSTRVLAIVSGCSFVAGALLAFLTTRSILLPLARFCTSLEDVARRVSRGPQREELAALVRELKRLTAAGGAGPAPGLPADR